MDSNRKRQKLLIKWHHRFNRAARAHYRTATSCRIFNYMLGIPLVAITVIVASDIFGLLEQAAQEQYPWKPDSTMEIEASIVALLSVLAPVLAALQTFLRFPERAEQHKNAAVKFGNLKKQVEMLIAMPPAGEAEIADAIASIQEQEARIMAETPSIGTISLFRSKLDVKPLSGEEISAAVAG